MDQIGARFSPTIDQETKILTVSGPELLELMSAAHERGASFRLKVHGESMIPFIQDGDVITIAPSSKKPYGIGNIVVFRHSTTRNPIVHRIVKKQLGEVLIKGDDIPDHTDGWITGDNILGVVTRVDRKGRSVHFGLGVERVLIAFLSRKDLLIPARSWLAKVRGRNR